MSTELERPDVDSALASLKDFQRATADYVFSRLYEDPDSSHRFLIADEVGLGKTLVAKGLIARAVDYLWDEVERIDVVYVCSNGDIARQNVNRLNITGRDEFVLPSRITLLPKNAKALGNTKLNFFALTPGTSLDPKSKLGRAEERALLHVLLERAWEIGHSKAGLKVLQGYADLAWFEREVRATRDLKLDEDLVQEFCADLSAHEAKLREAGERTLQERFADLQDRFRWVRRLARVSDEDRYDRRVLVGELRSILAASCITALQPDLVILDEFQRFKHLLDGDNDASQLAQELFNWHKGAERARVVLLSATPYKMYTVAGEAGGEDHFEDFIATLEFLFDDAERTARVSQLVTEYRRELFNLGTDTGAGALGPKRELEEELRAVMARTERLAVSEDRNGMLEQVERETHLERSDLAQYLALEDIAELLDVGNVLEYWKSAPYLLNFMEEYEMKRELGKALESESMATELGELVAEESGLALRWDDVAHYEEIDPSNARLRDLLCDMIETGLWRLLWIPSALPYYRSKPPFDQAAVDGATKRLVFSGWQLVPKMIATLVSFAAERNMMLSLHDAPQNTPEDRASRARLLDFSRSDGRLTGMPVLGLVYPSSVMARELDPLALALSVHEGPGQPTAEAVIEAAAGRLDRMLEALPVEEDGEVVDERWYWAAPILLDLKSDEEATRRWFDDPGLPLVWAAVADGKDVPAGWADHVEQARVLLQDPGQVGLGRRPADLNMTLAQTAIGGPAVCALRALARVSTADPSHTDVRDDACAIAWALRSLFNLPEVTAMVRGMNPAEPYWRRVVEYCVAGNLQAVLDEYAHTLVEALGLVDKPPEERSSALAEEIEIALGLRTASLRVDDLRLDSETGQLVVDPQRMRARFAARFGDDRSEEGAEVTRADQVRSAFNSPFWPFILATTSVGQEGLDFHTYCHVVVHWNLPSNPVDLEQREGRVHRYKGHAVRKNVARDYGVDCVAPGSSDPWAKLFEMASRDRPEGASELVPYWIYSGGEGSAKIERHVPALPLSRDLARLEALRRSLTVYRMAFGQARQEDLVAYLLTHLERAELEERLNALRIDLSPPVT